jgi:hypothetical protein
MRRLAHHFSDPQIERLRSMSRATGLPVAELLRRAIDEYRPPIAPEVERERQTLATPREAR